MVLLIPEFVAENGDGLSSSVASTSALASPGEAQEEGDFLVALCAAVQGATTWPTPSGWNLWTNFGTTNTALFYRTDGHEGSTVFTRATNTLSGASVQLARFKNVGGISTSPSMYATTTGDIVLPQIDVQLDDSLLVGIGLRISTGANTWTPPATFAEPVDKLYNNFSRTIVTKTVDEGLTGAVTLDTANTGTLRGVLLALDPLESGSPPPAGMDLFHYDGVSEVEHKLYYYNGTIEIEHRLTEVAT